MVPMPILSQSEEDNLCEFIQAVSQVGFPKMCREVKSTAEAVAQEKGVFKKSQISNGCVQMIWPYAMNFFNDVIKKNNLQQSMSLGFPLIVNLLM